MPPLIQEKSSRARNWFFQPVLAPLLEQRVVAAALAGIAFAHIVASAMGVSLWQCPIKKATHVACAGCGLTRAIMLLLHGDVAASLSTHAFALPLLGGVFLLFFAALLPSEFSKKFAHFVERIERRSGLVMLGLVALMAYWLARFLGGTLPI